MLDLPFWLLNHIFCDMAVACNMIKLSFLTFTSRFLVTVSFFIENVIIVLYSSPDRNGNPSVIWLGCKLQVLWSDLVLVPLIY